jgi:hypothetical protein
MNITLPTETLMDSAVTPILSFNVINNEMIGIIIPLLMLFITLVMFAIDFGVIGVGTTFSITIILFWLIGFIPRAGVPTIISLISLIMIIMITSFKVSP